MSKADKMFEELGYQKERYINNSIRYYGNKNYIIFAYIDKSVRVSGTENVSILSMQELKAINEKVKELGWCE